MLARHEYFIENNVTWCYGEVLEKLRLTKEPIELVKTSPTLKTVLNQIYVGKTCYCLYK
jgi:hypothetical protein